MATTKNATLRYQVLNNCFRNPGRKYFIDDLLDECNQALYEYNGIGSTMKKRQLFDDIKFMESSLGWSIPLDRIRDGHKVYFRYSDIEFSINNQPLNESEVNQLNEALLTLSRFKGMPQFGWVDEITAKLDSGLGLSDMNHKIIEFDQNDFLKGLEFITPIYNAILYKKALFIEYKSFKQEELQVFTVHPYFLKQYNNRWYVFGKNENSDYILNLSLDRINSISDSKIRYLENNTLNFEEYFEDIIGVSLDKNAKIDHIVLKINNNLFPYIQTKPIHGSQKVKESDGQFTIITLDLFLNYELESLLLSYGDGIEILEPEILINSIINRLESSLNNYKSK